MGNQVVTQQQKDFSEFLTLLREQADSTQDFEILSPRRTYFTSNISGWEFSDSTEFCVEDKGINLGDLFTFSNNAVYVIFHSFIKRKKRIKENKEERTERTEDFIPKLIENLKDTLTPRSQTHSFSGFHSSYSQVQHKSGKSTTKLNYDIYVWYGQKVSQITKAVSMSKVLELEKLIENTRVQEYLFSLFFNKAYFSSKVSPLFSGLLLNQYYEKPDTKLLSFNHLFSFLNKRAIPKYHKSPTPFHSTSERFLSRPKPPKTRPKHYLSTPSPSPPLQLYHNEKDFISFKIPKTPNRICNKHSIFETIKTSNSVAHNHTIEINLSPRRSRSIAHKVSSPRYNIQIHSKIKGDPSGDRDVSNGEENNDGDDIISINIDFNDPSPLSSPLSQSPRPLPNLQLNISNLNDLSPSNRLSISHNKSFPSNIYTHDFDNDKLTSRSKESEVNGKEMIAVNAGKVTVPKIDIPPLLLLKTTSAYNSDDIHTSRIESQSSDHSEYSVERGKNTLSYTLPLSRTDKRKKRKKSKTTSSEKQSPDKHTSPHKHSSHKTKEYQHHHHHHHHHHSNNEKSRDKVRREKHKRSEKHKPQHDKHKLSIDINAIEKSKKYSSTIPLLSLPLNNMNDNSEKTSNNTINNNKLRLNIDINLVNNDNNNINNNIINYSSPPSPNYLQYNLADRIRIYDTICSQITDNIYLGSNSVAKDKEKLFAHGITHILNCASIICDNYFPSLFHYKSFSLLDSRTEDVSSLFYDVLDYIDQVIKNNGKVFVHCYQGVSRSATMVILYMMWRNKTKFQETHEAVKRIREIANPNAGFICQLIRFFSRPRVNPPTPLIYQIHPHNSSPDVIALTLRDPIPLEMLDDNYCYLLQNSLNNLYLWKGKNSDPIYLEYAFIYAKRLQKFEEFDGELYIEESGNESEEFKSLMDIRKSGT